MKSATARATATVVAVIIAALVWGVQEIAAPADEPASTSSAPTAAPTPSASDAGGVAGAELEALLGRARISSAPDLVGYDRDCGRARRCGRSQGGRPPAREGKKVKAWRPPSRYGA